MKTFIVGFASFFLINLIGSQFLGPSLCTDGWASPSIGKQGACSHHGGVASPKGGVLLFWGSVIAGFLIGFGVKRFSKTNTTKVDVVVSNHQKVDLPASKIKVAPKTREKFSRKGSRTILEIKYQDANNDITTRKVSVISLIVRDDLQLLIAYCTLREEQRTFRLDRVKECMDIQTGEIIQDVFGYLVSRGTKTNYEIKTG